MVDLHPYPRWTDLSPTQPERGSLRFPKSPGRSQAFREHGSRRCQNYMLPSWWRTSPPTSTSRYVGAADMDARILPANESRPRGQGDARSNLPQASQWYSGKWNSCVSTMTFPHAHFMPQSPRPLEGRAQLCPRTAKSRGGVVRESSQGSLNDLAVMDPAYHGHGGCQETALTASMARCADE